VASLDAADALAERVDAIVAERVRVLAALRDQGWDVPDTQANFVWLPLGDDAVNFAASCDPVAVRPFAGDGVRVSIGEPDVNDQFLSVAARWRA
jgi:histidinol-phosphate aminotransferase